MRDPARIDRIIEKLRTAWKASPDLRLTQLVHSAAAQTADHRFYGVFYIEDGETERGLDIIIKASERRGANA